MHDPALPLRAHHRDHRAGQVVPAKEIRLEYRAQGVGGQVFDRAGQGVGAVVEQRIQRAAGGVSTSASRL